MNSNFFTLTLVFVFFPGLVCHALTLEEAVKGTLSTHPAIQSQMAIKESALVDVDTSKQQFYPTPSVSIEQVRSSASDASYGQQSLVQLYRLQQPLWTGGRLTAAHQKAQANLRTANEELRDMRQKMALRAVQGWTEWYLSSLRVFAQEKSVQAHLRLMEVVKRRVSEGAMAPSELSLTQSRLDQTLAQAQTFSAQMRVAKLRLSQLIGRPLTDTEVPVLAAGPAQCDVREMQGKAIQVSAAVKKVMSQQDALGFELQERRAELSPELYVRLERQRSPTSFGDSSVTNNRIYLGLSSRLGAGLSNFTALQSLEKRRNALEAEAEFAKRTVIEAVQSEHEQLVSLENRLPLLRKALDSTIQTAQAWDRQFLAGRRAWVEVMNAARETTQAEIEWGDANASQISTQWRLSIYCGQQENLSETANLKVN